MTRRRIAPIALVWVFLTAAASRAVGQSPVGEVHFANSGSPAAQPAFLRGLAQLHNFEYDDAAAAFAEAERTDPGFAMAYWGEAMTFNHPIWMEQNRDAARKALERLAPTPEARRSKAPTEREKAYLDAVEVLFGEGTKNERDVRYAEAMRSLSAKYPDDPDAAAFSALAILGTAHEGRDVPTYMRAAAILEELTCRYPNHPGAAHYLIHSYDDPAHAVLGLRAARRYSRIAPDAAHAQHMTSHIFIAMGMWDDVVLANETAVAVVNRGREKDGLPPVSCGHYPYWLEYGYLQQGRATDARRLLEGCRAQVGAADHSRHGEKPDPDKSPAASLVQMWARFLVDTNDWAGDVARWQIPVGDAPARRVTYEWTSGFGAVRRGDSAGARAALSRLSAARGELDADLAKKEGSDRSWSKRAGILEDQLRAMIDARAGDGDAALSTLRQAADAEAAMPFEFGPPFIDKPTQELLGELLLERSRPEDARRAFEAALARAPERTASLEGLEKAARAAGDTETATRVASRLRTIRQRGDAKPGTR
jgi:tetratricopeptide (TPR) repeat protein